jgi:hypothetical protein
LELVTGGLKNPAALVVPPDDSDRLFVLEKNGLVRIVQNDALLENRF